MDNTKIQIHTTILKNNKIKINKFENFLSFQDIQKKYGEDVLKIYKQKNYMIFDKSLNKAHIHHKNEYIFICDGEILFPFEFNNIINIMRECSNNLKKSIKEAEKIKPFIVEIT